MSEKLSPETARSVLAEADMIYTPDQVTAAISRLAREISAALKGRDPLVLPVMKGGMIPAGWLLPQLHFPLQIDYLHATRYRDGTAGGELAWTHKPDAALHGRVVLLIDDIYDEGVTLANVIAWCRQQGAQEVHAAVLFAKQHDRNHGQMWPDFVGLDVPDRYVFGAGMDYHGYLRNVPGVFAVKGL